MMMIFNSLFFHLRNFFRVFSSSAFNVRPCVLRVEVPTASPAAFKKKKKYYFKVREKRREGEKNRISYRSAGDSYIRAASNGDTDGGDSDDSFDKDSLGGHETAESGLIITERQREKHQRMAARFTTAGGEEELKSDIKGILKGSGNGRDNFASVRAKAKESPVVTPALPKTAVVTPNRRTRGRSESDIVASMERERRTTTMATGLTGLDVLPASPGAKRKRTGESPGRSNSEWVLNPAKKEPIYWEVGNTTAAVAAAAAAAARAERPKAPPPPPPLSNTQARKDQHYYSTTTPTTSDNSSGNNNPRKGSRFVQRKQQQRAGVSGNAPRGAAARRASLVSYNQQLQQQQQQMSPQNGRLSGSALVLTSSSSTSSSFPSSGNNKSVPPAAGASLSSSDRRDGPPSTPRKSTTYEGRETLPMDKGVGVRHSRSVGDIERLGEQGWRRETSPQQTVTITVNMVKPTQQQQPQPQQQPQSQLKPQQTQQHRQRHRSKGSGREDNSNGGSSSTTMSFLSNLTAAGSGRPKNRNNSSGNSHYNYSALPHQEQRPRIASNSSDYTDSTNSSYQPVDRRPHKKFLGLGGGGGNSKSNYIYSVNHPSSTSSSSLHDLTKTSRQLAHASSTDLLNHELLANATSSSPTSSSSAAAAAAAATAGGNALDLDNFRRTRDFGDFQILTNSPAAVAQPAPAKRGLVEGFPV